MNNDNEIEQNTTVIEENPFAQRAAAAATETKAVPEKARSGLLSKITTRKRRRPFFGLLYGPPGVGKTTFASTMPNVIIIPTERGADQISVDRFNPGPKNFAELWSMIVALDTQEHNYKTIVIDTIDAAELLIFTRIIEEGGPQCKTLENYNGGYNKWISRERELWVGLINKLTEMSERFNVLLIGHSQIKPLASPLFSGPYDAYQIKIQEKSAQVIKQAVDMILFASLDVNFSKDSPKSRKGRGVISGERIMYTQPTTGIEECKNRYSLESPLEFSWIALNEGLERFYDAR